MKRDMELVRLLMIYIEKEYKGTPLMISSFLDYDINVIFYHLELINNYGLINAKIDRFFGGGGLCICRGLTWEGQDFIASIRNDKVWKKVTSTIVDKGIDFTLEIIAKLSAKYTKELIGLD
jgi:hypothetical protein